MPQDQQEQQQKAAQYQKLVQQNKPKLPVLKNCFWAFVVGGLICVIGQVLINMFKTQGLSPTAASAGTSVILIMTTAILTGLGVWDDLAKLAGAGTIVPITGFANAMVAPALEFKREGMIFGVSARLFTIAGPVLVFGFLTAWLVGLVTLIVGRS
ncbi:MAG TPA: stage V sporulation protein AC [Bacillota bacterium]|nr:stage V sporulation protein AC [Bacillota bacterium]